MPVASRRPPLSTVASSTARGRRDVAPLERHALSVVRFPESRKLPSIPGTRPSVGTDPGGMIRDMHRKVVTVLFCDVVGSTALGESIDPEALQGLLARYFERMRGSSSRTAARWRSSSAMR